MKMIVAKAEEFNDCVYNQIIEAIKEKTGKKELVCGGILHQSVKDRLSADGYMIMQDNVQHNTTIVWT